MQQRAITVLKILVIIALNLFMIAFVAYAATIYLAQASEMDEGPAIEVLS